MTIKELRDLAKKEIGYINAKVLMEYILNKDISYIIANSDKKLKKEDEEKYLKCVEIIKNGYPLQYITNKQEFMKLEFFVDENVLIPQPDTEILVEKAIEYCRQNKNCKVLDLCTGSGAIAISIKKYAKEVQMIASDISDKALNIAKKNAVKNKVNIEFIKSNMFENIEGQFDLVVSNPPYIKTEIIQMLPLEVQKEPQIALDGGKDGLEFYKIISKNISKYLKPTGKLILEIGYDQRKEVTKLLKNSICIKDYGNKDRLVIWNHSQEE